MSREGALSANKRPEGVGNRVATRLAPGSTPQQGTNSLPRFSSSTSTTWGMQNTLGTQLSRNLGEFGSAAGLHAVPHQGPVSLPSGQPVRATGGLHSATVGQMPQTFGQGLPGGGARISTAPLDTGTEYVQGGSEAAGGSPSDSSPRSSRSGMSRPSTAVSTAASTTVRWPWLEETDFFQPGQAAALLGGGRPATAPSTNSPPGVSISGGSSTHRRSHSPTSAGIYAARPGSLGLSGGVSDISIHSSSPSHGCGLEMGSRTPTRMGGYSAQLSERQHSEDAGHDDSDAPPLPPEELAQNAALLSAAKRSQRKLSAALLMASKHTFKHSLRSRARRGDTAPSLADSASAPSLGPPAATAAAAARGAVVQLQVPAGETKHTAQHAANNDTWVAWADSAAAPSAAEKQRRQLETAVLSGLAKRKGGAADGARRNVVEDNIASRVLRRQATAKRKLQAASLQRKGASRGSEGGEGGGGEDPEGAPSPARGDKPQWYRPLQDLLKDSAAAASKKHPVHLRRRRAKGPRGAFRASDSTLGRVEPTGGMPRLMTAPALSSVSQGLRDFPHSTSRHAAGDSATQGGPSPSLPPPGSASTSIPSAAAAMRVHWSPTLHAPNQGLQSELNLDPVKASMRAIAMGHGGVKRLDASLQKVLRSTTAVQAHGAASPLDVDAVGADATPRAEPAAREGVPPLHTPVGGGATKDGFSDSASPSTQSRTPSAANNSRSCSPGGARGAWGAISAKLGGGSRGQSRGSSAGSKRSASRQSDGEHNMRGAALFAVASTQFRSRDDYPRLALSASTGWRPSPLVPEGVQYDTPRQVRNTVKAIVKDRRRSVSPPGRHADGFAADSEVVPWGFGAGGAARSETPLDHARRQQLGQSLQGLEFQLDAASPRSVSTDGSAMTRGSQETAVVMEHLDELLHSRGIGHSAIPTPRQRSISELPKELRNATGRSSSLARIGKQGSATPIRAGKSRRGQSGKGQGGKATTSLGGSTSQKSRSSAAMSSSSSSAAHFRLRSVVQASRQRQRERQLTQEDQMDAQNSAGEYLQILTAISSTAALRPSSVPAVVALHRARVRAALAKQRAHAHTLKRAQDKIAAEAAMKAVAEEMAAAPLDPVDTVQLKGEAASVANERAATAARLARGEQQDDDTVAAALAADVKRTDAELNAAESDVALLKRRKAFKPLPGPFPSRRGEAYRPQLLTEGDRRAFGLWASGLDDFVSDRQGMPRPGKGLSLRASADTRVAWMLEMARADAKVAARLEQRVAAYKASNMQDIGLKGTLGTDGLSAVTRNTLSSSLLRERPAEKRAAVATMAQTQQQRASSAAERRREVRRTQLRTIEQAGMRTQRLQERRVHNERIMTWVYLLKLTKSVKVWEKAMVHDRLLRPSSVVGNAAAIIVQKHWRGQLAKRWVHQLRSVRPILCRLVTQWRIRRRAKRTRAAATLLQDFICSHVLNLGAGGFAWQKYMKAFLARVRLVQSVVRSWLACRHARMYAMQLWWERLCQAEAGEADRLRRQLAARAPHAVNALQAEESHLNKAQSVFTDANAVLQAAALRLYLAQCAQGFSRARRQWVRQHCDLWGRLRTEAPGMSSVKSALSPSATPGGFTISKSDPPPPIQEEPPPDNSAATPVQPAKAAGQGGSGFSFAQLTVHAAFSGAAGPTGADGGGADSPTTALGLAAMAKASSALTGGTLKLDDAELASMTAMPPQRRRAFLARLALGAPEQVATWSKSDKEAVRWVGAAMQKRILDMHSYRGGVFINAPWQALLQTTISSGTDGELRDQLEAGAKLAASVQAHSPGTRKAQGTIDDASDTDFQRGGRGAKGIKGGKSKRGSKLARHGSKRGKTGQSTTRKKKSSKRGELSLSVGPSLGSGPPSPEMTPGSKLEASIMLRAAERAAASAQQWAGRPPMQHVFAPSSERRMALLEAVLQARAQIGMAATMGGGGGGYRL